MNFKVSVRGDMMKRHLKLPLKLAQMLDMPVITESEVLVISGTSDILEFSNISVSINSL